MLHPRKQAAPVGKGHVKQGRPRKCELGSDGKRRPEVVAELVDRSIEGPLAKYAPPEITNYDERQASAVKNAQVESVMRKGFTNAREISRLCNITPEQARNHMASVHVRWEVLGSGKDISRYRGEAISRFNTIIQECYSRLQQTEDGKSDDPRNDTALLNVIRQATADLTAMNGMTPKVIERQMLMASDKHGISGRIQKQDALIGFVKQLALAIQEQKGVKTITGTVNPGAEENYD